jgi:hypothetical protein
MQLSRKQLEFFGVIIVICTIISAVILLIDFGIKTAILEESVRLRLKIEQWERVNGLNTKTTANGVVDDAPINTPVPGLVLVDDTPGMETTERSNGAEKIRKVSPQNRRPKPDGQTTA